MNAETIVRAWKDSRFRSSLTADELAALPSHPSGETMIELDEAELRGIVGGNTANTQCQCVSAAGSCGYICTFTTECPFLTLCCG